MQTQEMISAAKLTQDGPANSENPPSNSDSTDVDLQNHFKSVSKFDSDMYSPPSDPDQRVEFVLHASGGGVNIKYGDAYRATGDSTLGYKDEMPFEFHVQNPAGYLAPPYIGVRPRDYINIENGNMLETVWFGYIHKVFSIDGSSKAYAFDYTERRLDQLYSWIFKNYPQASRKKVILRGQSMGAWGSMTYGLRRAHQYAAIFCTLPRWRQTMLLSSDGTNLSNDLTLPSGENYLQRMDMIAYIKDPSHKIPFIAWSIGKNDGYASWESQLEAVDALRKTKRGFVFAWNNGNHSDGITPMNNISPTYSPESFELGKGYPVIMNSSLDNDPVQDLEGGINLGFKWRNLVETSQVFEFEISNTLGAVDLDVTPQSSIFPKKDIKHITIPAGQWIKVTFK